MRNIAVKTDNVGDTLAAGAFNTNFGTELEGVCTSADFTLDPEAGPDVNTTMLSQSIAAYANAGSQYQDSGAADAYVLAIATNLKSVSEYYDGMMVVFKAGNTNTGASTINVASLGVKDLETEAGVVLDANAIVADKFYFAVYSLSDDRFELLIPKVSREYLGDGTDFTVATDATGDINQFCTARLFQAGSMWYIEMTFARSHTNAAITSFVWTISGITFFGTSNQGVAVASKFGANFSAASTTGGASVIAQSCNATSILTTVSGIAPLAGKPSWAD